MINPADISVIVQGAIDKQNTPHCLGSIRNYLPGAEIILSTWKGSDTAGLDYDVLIENDDPGATICDLSDNTVNNVNRQIISTLNGLNVVKTKYALKIRSDILLKNINFLNYFEQFVDHRNSEYNIFSRRIVINNFYTADRNTTNLILHPSDWVQFGLLSDLLKLWNIPLQPEPESSQYFKDKPNPIDINNARTYRYIPEQYILKSCLDKNNIHMVFEHFGDYNDKNSEQSDLIFANNFIIVDYENYGIEFIKFDPYKFNSNHQMTFHKWLKLYKKYCDVNFILPAEGSHINLSNISFVIQGELKPEIYPQITKNIRRFFPGAEIVLATYVGTSINGFDYDKVALIEDPGAYPYNSQPKAKPNNVNRQIQTTLAGLNIATRKYVFKMRSDFILNGRDFLSYFNQFPKSDPKYNVFDNKILAAVFFARDPRVKDHPLPFHPSDIAFFGLRSDLLNLFDIPLMPKEEATYYKHKKNLYCRYVPEQYLWINCLRKNGKNIVCDHQRDCNASIAEETERYIASNFIYLDYNQFNLIPTKKLRLFSENKFDNIITHIEWQKLYKQYVDTTHQVPNRDKVRDTIMHKLKRTRQYALIAKFMTFLIPLKGIRRSLRRKLIRAMTKNIRL